MDRAGRQQSLLQEQDAGQLVLGVVQADQLRRQIFLLLRRHAIDTLLLDPLMQHGADIRHLDPAEGDDVLTEQRGHSRNHPRRQARRIAVGDEGTCSPCTDRAALGWRLIGTLPAPGGPPCEGLNLCRCEKECR
jgi:hypothetical protein